MQTTPTVNSIEIRLAASKNETCRDTTSPLRIQFMQWHEQHTRGA